MGEGYLVHQPFSPKANSNATIVTINISDNTSTNTAIKVSVTIKAPKYISCLSSWLPSPRLTDIFCLNISSLLHNFLSFAAPATTSSKYKETKKLLHRKEKQLLF